MSHGVTKTDGSAARDRRQVVRIDRSQFSDRARYTCPNGHMNWDRTNNHVWCQSCRREYEHGRDIDAEHYEILDKKTGELIPWSSVELER